MIVKIVGTDGSFDLIGGVKRCSFRRSGSVPSADIVRDDGKTEHHPISHSAFVLNDEGKTFDQFHSSRNSGEAR